MTEIDPAIWHQPQMRRALAQHDIAAAFQLLRAAGIRQRELAEMLGWQQSAVSEVVHGLRVQSYATLERICVRLGLPRGLMGLSYGDGDPPAQLQDEGHPRSFVARVSTVLFGRPVLTEFAPLPLSGDLPARVGRADAAEISDFTARVRALDRTHGGLFSRTPLVLSLAG